VVMRLDIPAGGVAPAPRPRQPLGARAVRFMGLALLMLFAGSCGSSDERRQSASPSGQPSPETALISQGEAEPFAPSENAQLLIEAAAVHVRQEAEWSYTIVVDLHEKNVAEVTYTLDPTPRDLGGLPETGTPLRAYSFDRRVTSEGWGFEWRTEYVVPTDSFPPDAFTARPGEHRAWLDHVVLALTNPRAASASDGTGMQVVVEGVVKETGLEAVSRTVGSSVAAGADGVLGMISAFDMSATHRNAMRRIARLGACVENPPEGGFRQRSYRENPGEQQRDRQAVRNARTDIMSNTSVRFVGAMAGQASGFVRWLGFVMGPATAWADSRAAYFIEETLRELERRISECEDTGLWAGTLTHTRVAVVTREGTSTGTCCYGRPTTTTARYEQVSSWEQRWTLGETLPDSTPSRSRIEAQSEATVQWRQSQHERYDAWASCRGEQLPSWRQSDEHGEGEAELSETTLVTVRIDPDGTFRIVTAGQPRRVSVPVEMTVKKAEKGCFDTEREERSRAIEPSFSLPPFTIRGEVDRENPGVLVGSEERRDDEDDDLLIIEQWHWDLRRQ
jgi:hypothetical protein